MPKFILERHAYAPELNKIHLEKGGSLPAPGCTSIKEARAKLFPRIPEPVRVFTYQSHYPAEYKWLERRHDGRSTYATALAFLRDRIAGLLPCGRATLTARLIG